MKYYPIIAVLAASLPIFASSHKGAPAKPSDLSYWFDASFTYWYAKEDGLNAAESGQVDGSGTTLFASSPAVFQQEFGYKPGFMVGMGLTFARDWQVYGEYTYYRGKTSVGRDAPAGASGTGVWSLDSWYLQETFFSQQSLTGTRLSSAWHLALDMGDLLLSRPIGKNEGFAFAAFGGLRTVWIRQQMNLNLDVAAASFGGSGFLGPQPVSSKNQSHSWSLGPRIGVDGAYNLPLQFHLDGTIGASLLFTGFDVKHREEAAANFYQAPAPLHMSYNSVRPELDLSLGFGWRRDFCAKQNLNLEISYDFTYFWGQNMMRSFMDEYVAGTSAGGLDLYFQGVALKAAYTF